MQLLKTLHLAVMVGYKKFVDECQTWHGQETTYIQYVWQVIASLLLFQVINKSSLTYTQGHYTLVITQGHYTVVITDTSLHKVITRALRTYTSMSVAKPTPTLKCL